MTASSVGIVLSKPQAVVQSDPYYTQRVQVVVWAATSDDKLSYYSYWDHPRQDFAHTDALLQQLAPVGVIHVTAGEGLHVGGKKGNTTGHPVVTKLTSWLDANKVSYTGERLIDTNSDPACETLVQSHSSTKVSQQSIAQLPAVLQELLVSESHDGNGTLASSSLHIAGDPALQGSTQVSQALVFFLQAEGLWENSVSGTKYTLRAGVLNSHLVLDRTAAESMHLWPPQGVGQAEFVGGTAQNNSLAGLLSSPLQTVNAKRRLESWLRQPLVDLDQLQQRQDTVAFFVSHAVGRDAVRGQGLAPFKGMDLAKLSISLASYEHQQPPAEEDAADQQTTGSTRRALQTMYELYLLSSQKLPLLLEQVEQILPMGDSSAEEPVPTLLQKQVVEPLQEAVSALSRASELTQSVLDLRVAPREFLIQSSYKPELVELEQELEKCAEQVNQCHADMNEQWQSISGVENSVRLEKGVTAADWQFRLPDTNSSKILQQHFGNSKVTVHRILKNGVYFSTPDLRALAIEHEELVGNYQRHQRQVALDAAQVAASYSPVVEQASDSVALLDLLTGLAHTAAYRDYCRPTLSDGEEDGLGIVLKQARHPCVELQENVEFIPNDIELKLGESSCLLVTGPNSTLLWLFCLIYSCALFLTSYLLSC